MAEILKLCGNFIERGENRIINLNIAKLPSSTKVEIPIYVYRSVNDGPVLLILAGLHGDEINGIEIIRRAIATKTVYPVRGTVIAIPIFNIYGFINQKRETPDGKDINRSFPGSIGGSLASAIAYAFTNDILPAIDLGLDLHTGGDRKSNIPQIRCDFNYEKNLEYASAFNPPFIINSPLMDKTIRKTAQKSEKPILVYETGESLRLDNPGIEEGLMGIRRLMKYLGMSDAQKLTENNSIVLAKNSWLRAKSSGLFRPLIKVGDKIKKRQVIGVINDPFGSFEHKLKAPHDCYVFGINHMPVVHQGEAIFHIGFDEIEPRK
jgi:hypothetical protein